MTSPGTDPSRLLRFMIELQVTMMVTRGTFEVVGYSVERGMNNWEHGCCVESRRCFWVLGFLSWSAKFSPTIYVFGPWWWVWRCSRARSHAAVVGLVHILKLGCYYQPNFHSPKIQE